MSRIKSQSYDCSTVSHQVTITIEVISPVIDEGAGFSEPIGIKACTDTRECGVGVQGWRACEVPTKIDRQLPL